MSFGKFLKDNFYEAETKKEDKPVTSQPVQQIYTPTPTFNSPVTQVTPSVLDGIRQHIKDVIKNYHDSTKQNDYYTFVVAKNAMASSIPGEADRYKIALLSLSATGLTKEQVVNSSQQYLSAIDTEISNFMTAYGPSYQQGVESKKAGIQQKQQQVIDLTKQLQDLNVELQKINDEVAYNENQLTTAKSAFEQASKEAKDEINLELQKINQYIQ